jgi:nitroreductase
MSRYTRSHPNFLPTANLILNKFIRQSLTIRESENFDTIVYYAFQSKYLKKEIPDAILNDILIAATRASNTGNMQTYSIIVTKDDFYLETNKIIFK